MVRHLLCDLEFTAIPEVFGDPRGAERMISDLRLDSRGERPAADHSPGIGLRHRLAGESIGSPTSGAEKVALTIAAHPDSLDIGMQVVVKVVVAGHLMSFSALLV